MPRDSTMIIISDDSIHHHTHTRTQNVLFPLFNYQIQNLRKNRKYKPCLFYFVCLFFKWAKKKQTKNKIQLQIQPATVFFFQSDIFAKWKNWKWFMVFFLYPGNHVIIIKRTTLKTFDLIFYIQKKKSTTHTHTRNKYIHFPNG